jgi:CBS domain-containing protein
MSLQKFCERPVVTVSLEQNIVEACQLMREKNVGCLVAVEGEKLRGILTDRDIALKVTAEKKDPQQTKVRDIMTANPTRIVVSKTLHDLTALMHTHHVRRVPIMDGADKVLGMVTLDDLLILLGQELADIGQGVSGALFRQPHSGWGGRISSAVGMVDVLPVDAKLGRQSEMEQLQRALEQAKARHGQGPWASQD